MTISLSASFATSMQTHEHARIAEQLGYSHAWFYDSPPILADVWVQMCRAAERTEHIGIGPGVLIPSLRHPLTNASAIATLVSIAGAGRVQVGIGSGFTGRLMMGQRPLPWADVSRYAAALRALLRGEEVEWDGRIVQMSHWPGTIGELPIEVPLLFAVSGPKGVAAATETADGIIVPFAAIGGFERSVALVTGTVLREGEDPGSERVMNAAGHAGAIAYHFAVEFGGMELPRLDEYAAALEDVPAEVRHLALHQGHLCGVSERDRPFVTGELMAAVGAALSPAAWRERIAGLEAEGATEITYQPAGDDIPGELEAFAKMMHS